MTTEKAMDLALEALKELVAQTEARLFAVKHDHVALQNAREAITAIKQARSAPVQEPVAWLHTKIEGVAVPHRPADLDKHPDRWTALYPEPKPCPTCEALARTVMMDQTAHDAQRKPLTDEKIEALAKMHFSKGIRTFKAAVRAIEAAHGIKENT